MKLKITAHKLEDKHKFSISVPSPISCKSFIFFNDFKYKKHIFDFKISAAFILQKIFKILQKYPTKNKTDIYFMWFMEIFIIL